MGFSWYNKKGMYAGGSVVREDAGGRMKCEAVSIKEIERFLEAEEITFKIRGNSDGSVSGFSSIEHYEEGTLAWIKNLHRFHKLGETARALDPALVIVDEEVDKACTYPNRLICDNPKHIFYMLLQHFFEKKRPAGTGTGSVISETAVLGENVSIGCNCVIEDGVTIGDNTRIYHNVVIREGSVLGRDCVIKSGTVIGEEGYGYSEGRDGFSHVPHFGHVSIGDQVEIGSNCSIDRGVMKDTVIGDGSKIDNLCHIAHNVCIGRHVRVVAGVVIGGSANIHDGVYIAPGGIVRNRVQIGEGSLIGLGGVVIQDVEEGKVMAGVPVKVLRDAGKEDL